jgi:hypothetical protein
MSRSLAEEMERERKTMDAQEQVEGSTDENWKADFVSGEAREGDAAHRGG